MGILQGIIICFGFFTGLLTMLLLVFSGMSNLCEEGWNGYREPYYDATWEFFKDILYWKLSLYCCYASALNCVVTCFGFDLVPAYGVCNVWL